MSNTHTPGPWAASNYHALGGYPVRTVEPDTIPIAIVPDLADARLIAEAPAMLEALRAIRAKAAECGNDTSAPDHVAALFYDIVEDANDILARIDGEAAQ